MLCVLQVKKEEDWEEFFEDDATRELKQIFQGQAALTDIVRELHRKMDEIIGNRVTRIYADSAADSHTSNHHQCLEPEPQESQLFALVEPESKK